MLILALALLAPPDESAVQGLYEGTCRHGEAESKLEARMVAQGKSRFKLWVRRTAADGSLTKAELEGEAGALAGGGWIAAWADGSIKGACGEGCVLSLERVRRTPPTLGKAPPEGAVVLLDGKEFSRMTRSKTDAPWEAADDGSIQVPKGGMNSAGTFEGSFDLHVEFLCPLQPPARSQGRGNSGVYLPNGEEIQVLDSFGMDTYEGGGCGGLYRWKNPDAFDVFSLASLPPLEWQAYDVEYRIDGAGKPRITVLHNGIRIHDSVELRKDARAGRFHFQDHGNPVRYRNIWVVPRP